MGKAYNADELHQKKGHSKGRCASDAVNGGKGAVESGERTSGSEKRETADLSTS